MDEAMRREFERVWLDEQENVKPGDVERAWAIWRAAYERGQAEERERTKEAVNALMDFAERLHTMSDEELEAWRQAALRARALPVGGNK